jgi:hypothetical protein
MTPPRRSDRILTKAFALAAISGALATGRLAAQTPAETPEQVAGRYLHAMAAQQWDSMAVLMHPYALQQLHTLLAPLVESPTLDAAREQLLGVHSLAEARALSDTAFFAAFLGHVLVKQPGVLDVLQRSRIDLIGHVAEGPDTVHIVYRLNYSNGEVAVTKMDIFPMQRFGATWRGLLNGDFRPLAAMLRRQSRS